MARLIDATRIEQFILNNCSDNEEINTIYAELINAPSIDLVRCRECKHSKEWYADRCLCYLWAEEGVSVFEDGYCSYGERKE